MAETRATAIAFSLGLLVGALASWASAPTNGTGALAQQTQVQAQVQTQAPSSHQPPQRTNPKGPLDQGDSDVPTVELQQARTKFLQRWGRPPVAPEPLSTDYEEEAVTLMLEKLFEQVGGELLTINCERYPCHALGIVPADYLITEADLAERGYLHGIAISNQILNTDQPVFEALIALPATELTTQERLFTGRLAATSRQVFSADYAEAIELVSPNETDQ